MSEKNNHTTRFNQTLPVDLYERLKAIAAKEAGAGKQMKVQALVVRAVAQFLEGKKELT